MDKYMAISGERVRASRESRAWSQAHLAQAAGLSLRTVQRVEATGTASAETRLAIAAALGVPLATLDVPEPPPAMRPVGEFASGVPIVFATSALGLLFVLWIGKGLPAMVASHFGVTGEADGSLPRGQFVGFMGFMLGAFPTLMLWGFSGAVRRGMVNIPNAGFWLAEPRRAATERWLHAHFTWFCVGVTVLLAYVFWLVAAANRATTAHPTLDTRWTTAGIAVFLACATAWIVVLTQRFKRDSA